MLLLEYSGDKYGNKPDYTISKVDGIKTLPTRPIGGGSQPTNPKTITLKPVATNVIKPVNPSIPIQFKPDSNLPIIKPELEPNIPIIKPKNQRLLQKVRRRKQIESKSTSPTTSPIETKPLLSETNIYEINESYPLITTEEKNKNYVFIIVAIIVLILLFIRK